MAPDYAKVNATISSLASTATAGVLGTLSFLGAGGSPDQALPAGLLLGTLAGVVEISRRVASARGEDEEAAARDQLQDVVTSMFLQGFALQRQQTKALLDQTDLLMSAQLDAMRLAEETGTAVGSALDRLATTVSQLHQAVDLLKQESAVTERSLMRALELIELRHRLENSWGGAFGFVTLEDELFADGGGGDDAARSSRLLPQLMRPTGPNWADLAAGVPYRRDEVTAIVDELVRLDGASVILLQGEGASGKSVMARQVGFEMALRGRPVYHAHLRKLTGSHPDVSTWQALLRSLAGGLEASEALMSARHEKSPDSWGVLFIVEDLHGAGHEAALEFVRVVSSHCPRHSRFVLATRPGPDTQGRSIADAALPYSPAARAFLLDGREEYERSVAAIAPHLWATRWRLASSSPPFEVNEQRMGELVASSSPSLWLLAWIVAGHSGEAGVPFARRAAYEQARLYLSGGREPGQDSVATRCGLAELERKLGDVAVVPALVLLVSAFSRLERPVSRQLLSDTISPETPASADDVRTAIAGLLAHSELVSELDEHGSEVGVRLPHSALADVYVQASSASGGAWAPTRSLRTVLGEEDWATEAMVRGLEAGDTSLLYALTQDFFRSPDNRASFYLHPRARQVLLQVSQRALRDDPDPSHRHWAVQCLGQTGDTRAIPALTHALLTDTAHDVAQRAAWELGEFGGAGGAALIAALESCDERVRGHAATVLGVTRNRAAVKALVGLLSDTVEQVTWAAARALGEIGDGCAVQPLLDVGLAGDDGLRATAAHALGYLRSPEAVAALIAVLEDESENDHVRESAAWGLGETGDPNAVRPLVAALSAPSCGLHGVAAIALGKLRDVSAVGPLIASLQSPDAGVRRAAAAALGSIGDRRALQPLIGTVLTDGDPTAAGAAAESLEALGDPSAIPVLRRALSRPMERLRANAARALGVLGAAEAEDDLVLLLGDEGFEVAPAAAEAVARLGCSTAVEPLIVATRSSSILTRFYAALALGVLRDARAVPPLILLLHDPQRHMEVAPVIAVLGDPRREIEVGHLIDAARIALTVIGKLAVPSLIAALDDTDRFVRLHAVAALADIGDPSALEALCRAKGDPDGVVRSAAAQGSRGLPDGRRGGC